MKRKSALFMAVIMGISVLTGCGGDSGEEKDTANTGQSANSVFTGELEENVTIRVLENDTAISKGYFDELINAFNEEYKDK